MPFTVKEAMLVFTYECQSVLHHFRVGATRTTLRLCYKVALFIKLQAPHFDQHQGAVQVTDGKGLFTPALLELLLRKVLVIIKNGSNSSCLSDPGQVGHLLAMAVIGQLQNPPWQPFRQHCPFQQLFKEIETPDMLDGTPVLDIKPYIPYADSLPDASHGWLDDAGLLVS